MNQCPFCTLPVSRIQSENTLALAFYDGYPVSKGHCLIIPKRHACDYWELTNEELLACNELMRQLKTEIISEDSAVTGFNIGLNAGESAGQTVFHCHFHLIPRRHGDVLNPEGGVRHVIPGKGNYSADTPQ